MPFGGRVLLALPPGLDFVRAFWACILIGRVAVPVPAPDAARLLHSGPRLRGIVDDAQAALVLTSASLLDSARSVLEPAVFASSRWMSMDDLRAAPEAVDPCNPVPDAGTLAYLQYTSGSTRAPRGVRLTHANVIANLRGMNQAWRIDGDSRVLTWLPHFHDYGLVLGTLLPVCAGATSWLMSPLTFLRRPLRWLEAMSALRITHSGAPEFAYAACLRALDGRTPEGDLSSLVSLSCGAEPLRAETVEGFVAACTAAGMRPDAFVPTYGMAETVLGVSASLPGRAASLLSLDAKALQSGRVLPQAGDATAPSLRLVGCGHPIADTAIAIVDADNGAEVAPARVGEIWVRSPAVGQGYWRQPETSEATFGAHLPDGRGPFLRTGDLGFLHEGEIFVTGRLKDLVIVHGANHYPQDLEWTAEHAHAALRRGYGAAFTVEADDGEALVLALEIERRAGSPDATAIAMAVRRAIGEAHGLAVEAVVLVRAGVLPRSSSGKIQRQRSRRLYLDGLLDVQAEIRDVGGAWAGGDMPVAPRAPRAMPRDGDEQALWRIWRDVLGTDAFGVHDSFFALGGTSLRLTQVASRIALQLGVDLSLEDLFQHLSIAALAAHVGRVREAGVARLAPGQDAVPLQPSIPRVARGGLLSASLSQRRMWVIQQFDPASSAYNVSVALRLRGALDVSLLQRAVDLMVERHEALRTGLVLDGAEPKQCILPAVSTPIEHVDLGAHADRLARARALLGDRLSRPFDLAQAPLHRLTLVRFNARDHVLAWVMHHTVTDNWAYALVLREMLGAYSAWQAGLAPRLAPIAIGYADYAAWQRDPVAVAEREPQMDYWRRRLVGLTPLDLPTDFPRPARPSFRGARVSATLPAALREALRSYCVRASATPFIVMLAAFKQMLRRQTGSVDIAVGSPVANRHRLASEPLVGTLVNTLVMRTHLGGDPSFDSLVARVRNTALQAYAHQDTPFDELVGALDADRTTHPEGLVRVLFNVLNAPLGRLDQPGLEVEEFPIERSSAQFDLSVHVDTEFAQRVHFEYSTDLYAQDTVERMLDNYLVLLERLLGQPSQRLSAVPNLAPAQLAFLRDGWNATQAPLPAELLVHRYLSAAHAVRPDAIAAVDASDATLTYRALAERSNALARALRQRGIGRGHCVGLGITRDVDMLVALLGVLKAGAAYVPLDPAFPIERLNFMAGDAGLSALLVRGVPANWLADAAVPTLRWDESLLAGQPVAELEPDAALDARPLDPAYMIYTSGSTGQPKGVAVPHRAVVNFLASMAREPGLDASDRLAAVTTLSFDIAVLELLLPLAVGARVLIADAAELQDPHALCAMLARHEATVMQATPTLWRLALDAGWRPPEGARRFRALIGGEPLPATLARRLLDSGAELWNMYGPTETTVWSTVWRVSAPEQGIAIGRPIANTEVQVRDADGHICPIGVPGELCIGGLGLALGYHGCDELTAARFPSESTNPDAPRFYRTGDRGRWRHDGQLEHLGRMDRQVKLRGLRIELGDVEAAMLDHPGIAQGVAAVHVRSDDDARLAVYVVARGDAPDAAQLREHMRRRLPEYMLPQHVIVLDALPLLPNGKIDRKALPAPQPEARHSPAVEADEAAAAAPATPPQKAIAEIWSELLGVDDVDLRDNFFDLGGHSLLAMQAVVEVRRRLGWKIQPPRLVYETLGQLAREENLSAS